MRQWIPLGHQRRLCLQPDGHQRPAHPRFSVRVQFKVAKLNARFFGDFAENLDGSKRAAAAVAGALTNNPAISLSLPLQKNDNKAYQIGFGIAMATTSA